MEKDKETNDKKKVYTWWLNNGSASSANAIATELGQIIITETGQNIIEES